MKAKAKEYRDKLIEAVSDFDDVIAEKYLNGEEVSVEELMLGVRKATISLGRHKEEVAAVELGREEAVAFIRDVLAPVARQSRLGGWFVRYVDRINIDDPQEAALGRPVFELFITE